MEATKVKGIVNEEGQLIIEETINLSPGEVKVLIFNSATPVNPDFDITLKRLLELKEIDLDLDENDEDEIYYPSDYAFSGSIQLLNELYKFLGDAFPRGYASVESRGGIDLIWNNKQLDKKVWIEFPVNENFQPSVYYQIGDQSNLIKQPETSFIAKLLEWLFTEDILIVPE